MPTIELANSVLCGDAAQIVPSLPQNFVDCIVTSPPYFQQRKYGNDSEIGQELSPQAYISKLSNVFESCLRVLKPSGTLWINLGDKYSSGRLLGLPWKLALALADQGWVLRSDIIWHKSNAMPSAARKRPTVDHEYVFFFTKGDDYYYNADAIREPHVTFSEHSQMKGGRGHFGKKNGTPEAGKYAGYQSLHDGDWTRAFHPSGRNKRTVWKIALSKNRDAHFAVFPRDLVRTCILAGCPEGGIVLDPFLGSGTTAIVAAESGRRYLGIDCVQRYVDVAEAALKNVPKSLF